MDVQENAPLSAGEDTLAMISELRGTEAAEEAPAGESAPASVGVEPAETVEEADSSESEEQAEARRNALLREIAMDPNLTNQYVQQQYQAPQQNQQIDQDPILPFDEFSFDPSNPEHQRALFNAQLQEVGGPLFDKIDAIAQRFEREEQERQAQQFQQVADHANQKTVEFLDTYVPGFGNIAQKVAKGEDWTVQEEAIFNLAVNMESQFLQAYPQAVYDVQARAQIAQQIGPILKEKAKALGLVAQPSKPTLTAEQKQEMKREMYVESSNAVPTSTASNFEKALEKGDELSMIRALRRS